MDWKTYLPSSIAGLFIAAQFVLMFFFSVEGVQGLRTVGYILWVVVAILGFLPMISFHRKGGVPKGKSYIHTTKIVDTGIYGIIRHPQYLAFPLFSLAIMLVSQHWSNIVLGVPATVIGYWDALHADQGCIEKFGEEYRQYMQRVPRLNLFVGIYRLLEKKFRH
jgi:protein-S-isoprenylcysteine O-methyltransferase Ste14